MPERVIGDPNRLRQIIVNLVGNAIKFTERGEVVVEVESQTHIDGDLQLHFSIRDTGIGIPTSKQKQIFEAFSQVDASTTRRFGGTGLGLAISAQLVRMMGGRIWVESEIGRGTTFHFTGVFGVAKDQPSTNRFDRSSLSGLRTLVVDDNATNRRILDEMLHSWKLAPTVTESGVAALTEMQRAANDGDPYRLVLLDCMMPGMDGFSLAELINGNTTLASPSMIMISSAARPGDFDRCRSLRIARHMTKPVIKSELFDAIVEALHEPLDEPEKHHTDDPTPGGPSLRILLVEDGLINQRVATGFLERKGHRVALANNGREAIDALENEAFDVVLMDVQMPVMDGLETTQLIRQQEQQTGAHQKIIAMTASAMKGDRERCLEAGMDAYVSKPIDPDLLDQALSAQMGSVSSPDVAEAEDDAPAENSPQDVFDAEAAEKKLGADLLRDLLRLFLTECPKLIGDVRDGLSGGDSKSVQRAAHTLKNSSRTVGAPELADFMEEVEQLAIRNQVDDIRDRMSRAEAAAEAATTAIREWLV